MSCARISMKVTPRASRQSSLTCSVPPNSMRERRTACSRVRPDRICFSTWCSRWKRSSSSSSFSTVLRRSSERKRKSRSLSMTCLLSRPWHLGDSSRQPLPGILFYFKLACAESLSRHVVTPSTSTRENTASHVEVQGKQRGPRHST